MKVFVTPHDAWFHIISCFRKLTLDSSLCLGSGVLWVADMTKQHTNVSKNESVFNA